MSNSFDDKLDKILSDHGAEQGEFHYSLKKAITTLIKELVAEAKPTRSETQLGNLIIYGDLSKRDLNIIYQFEQNLLKALEEV